MNILLTGASGFIGRSFKKSSKHKIYSLSNGNKYRNDKNTFFVDLTNKVHIKNLLEDIKELKIDTIFHSAAITPFSSKSKPDYDDDLTIAENILFITENLHIKKIFFTSGWNVYDPANKVPFSEQSNILPSTDYGKSKLKVEQYFKNNLKNSVLVNIRFASLYGPGQISSGLIPNSVSSALRSHTITIKSVKTKRDYLYIDDAMDAVKKLLSLKIYEHTDVNIGSNTSYTVKSMAETIKMIMKKKYNFNIKIIVDSNFLEAIPLDNRLDISKAQQIINFYPSTKLIDGLSNYIVWIKQNV